MALKRGQVAGLFSWGDWGALDL